MEPVNKAQLIAKYKTTAQQAMVDKAEQLFDPQKFADAIMADLTKRRSEVTLKLLGLDNRWGKWEVDHCNGRQSPINDYLTEATRQQVQTWVVEAVETELANGGTDKVRAAMRAAVRNHLKGLSYDVERHIRRMIDDHAIAVAKQVMEEMLADAVSNDATINTGE